MQHMSMWAYKNYINIVKKNNKCSECNIFSFTNAAFLIVLTCIHFEYFICVELNLLFLPNFMGPLVKAPVTIVFYKYSCKYIDL